MGFFGSFVGIDGDTIVVSGVDSNDANVAFVFVKDGGEGGGWTLQAKLTTSLSQIIGGVPVAVDGDRIVVGVHTESNNIGAVFVFEQRSGISWSQTQILAPSGNADDGSFGFAVDLEGDSIVVGAYGRNGNKGAVHVFALNETNTWEETKMLEASDGDSGHDFGISVAVSGNTIAVGSRKGGSDSNGRAYIYTGPNFDETASLLQGDASGADDFGTSVAIYLDIAVVGSPGPFQA
jgi:hypothetical protein